MDILSLLSLFWGWRRGFNMTVERNLYVSQIFPNAVAWVRFIVKNSTSIRSPTAKSFSGKQTKNLLFRPAFLCLQNFQDVRTCCLFCPWGQSRGFRPFEVPISVASHICVCLQVPGLCEDLLSSVDQPLKIARDKVVEKDYLLCDYNRDGDSYRSIS